MTARRRRHAFLVENDLEDYLEAHLSRLLSPLGPGLLIIGRQVKTVGHGDIDLFAIDGGGVTYIIELKLNEASPAVISQVLDYRHWVKRLDREELVRTVAAGELKVDLVDTFQRHFGHPLPETVNEYQVLTIIAFSIHRRTAHSILELKDGGYSIETFRYVAKSDGVDLIPCCRDDRDIEACNAQTTPPVLVIDMTAPSQRRPASYRVHIDVSIRWFWMSQAQLFVWPIMTFGFIYQRYEQWAERQGAEGLQVFLLTTGQFGRQLAAIIAETDEWARVLVAPGSEANMQGVSSSPPSTREHRDADHRIVAYLRNPTYTGT